MEIGLNSFKNRYIISVYNLLTKLIGLYPTPIKSVKAIASAYFRYMAIYGVRKYIRTDPGSEYTALVFQQLNTWLCITPLQWSTTCKQMVQSQ